MKKNWILIAALVLVAVITVAVLLGVFVLKPSMRYKDAMAKFDAGEYREAALLFSMLGDYKDAPEKFLLSRYNEAEAYEKDGRIAMAAMTFGAIADYSNARSRSFVLWGEIALRETVSQGKYYMLTLHEYGTVSGVKYMNKEFTEIEDFVDYDAVAVDSAEDICAILTSDGTIVTNGGLGFSNDDYTAWRDIVAFDLFESWNAGAAMVGLRADGTVVYQKTLYSFENECGQDNVSGWRNIVDVACSITHTVGLRADGTVIAAGDNEYGQCDVDSWRDIVAIEVSSEATFGLTVDGTVLVAYDRTHEHTNKIYDPVRSWTDIVKLSVSSDSVVGLCADGTVLYSSASSLYEKEICTEWSGIRSIVNGYSAVIGLSANQGFAMTETEGWEEARYKDEPVAIPARLAFLDFDDRITVDVNAEKNLSTGGFYNKFGTPTTHCAHLGCNNYIAKYGDTNCCTLHSAKCLNCSTYIDEDAVYCMECIEKATKK